MSPRCYGTVLEERRQRVRRLVLASRPRLRRSTTIVGIAAYAVVSLCGTHDHLEYTGAMWTAVHFKNFNPPLQQSLQTITLG